MREILVPVRDGAYSIFIENGVLGKAGDYLRGLGCGNRVAAVSDEAVWSLYGERFTNSLAGAGLAVCPIVVPAGEGSKSMAVLERVYTGFAAAGIHRSGIVAALGGGVAGDLCGYAAATYMRGIRYVQIPTTLLAQVDSSVGGKTAVTLAQGKNLVGAFHQPSAVLIDPATLETLPPRELRCGVAEVIKYAAIGSRALFDRLRGFPIPDIAEIIQACCSMKSAIVAGDEHDHGERMKLNFGHTFGHAAEIWYGLSGLNHGEAVGIGMLMACAVGEELGLSAAGTFYSLRQKLNLFDLPVCCKAETAGLLTLMKTDKKAEEDSVTLVLPYRIGEAFLHRISYRELEEVMGKVERRWKTG